MQHPVHKRTSPWHNRLTPMNTPVTQLLAQLSDALAAHVAAAAALVTAIRIGPNRLISGIVWRADVVVTSDQALPAQDSYSLTVVGRTIGARPRVAPRSGHQSCLPQPGYARRQRADPSGDRSGGRRSRPCAGCRGGRQSRPSGSTAIHRIGHGTCNGSWLAGRQLSCSILPATLTPEGGPVLDARGGLLGMASAGPQWRGVGDPATRPSPVSWIRSAW